MQEPFPTDALAGLLVSHPGDIEGLLLRLSWRVGLTRNEIEHLQWEQCAASQIRLEDRAIPLEPEVAVFLSNWHKLCDTSPCPYVAISKRKKTPMQGAAISQMVKRTLQGAGIEGITLIDLRHDYIRRQLESRDWQEALQITGLPVSSYFKNQDVRNLDALKSSHEKRRAKTPAIANKRHILSEETERALHTAMEQEKDSLAGLAMALAHDTTIGIGEIVSLTWDQIRKGAICLPDREIPLPEHIWQTLERIYEERSLFDDPHVFLTERSRKPMDESWLLVLVRKPLIRYGIGSVSLRDIRAHVTNKAQQTLILDSIDRKGYITSEETAELLSVTPSAAGGQLRALLRAGELVRVNDRYYRAEDAPSAENRKAQLAAYMQTYGPSLSAEMAEHLHIGKRLTAKVLREMCDSGEVYLNRKTGLYDLT